MQTLASKRTLVAGCLVTIGLTVGLITVQAGPADFHPFYYNDAVYLVTGPGELSANPNQLTWECYTLGPDLNGHPAIETNPFYVILWEGGQHSCPGGGVEHDHVAAAIPGTRGFRPHWRGVLVIPLDPAVLPLTSEAAIMDAEAAGQVWVIDTGIVFNAPVVRRARF